MTRKLIRKRALREKLGGVSDTTLWRRERDGTLPRSISIGGVKVWDEAEVDAILDERLAGRGPAAA